MKRIILVLIGLFILQNLFSQNKNIELMKGKIEDAKVQVDNNILNPEKNTQAETWYLAAFVYTRMAKSEVYNHLEEFPGEKALGYIKKSKGLDKEQKLYSEQINVLLDLGPSFYNKAIKNYNSALKDSSKIKFELALRYFDDYFDLLDVLKDDEKYVKQIIEYSGVNHKDIYFYSGFSAAFIGKTDRALELYSSLIDFDAEKSIAAPEGKPLAYLYSSNILAEKKDYATALKTIRRGLDLYPDNEALILSAISLYKTADKMDDMINQMEEVVKSNPKNQKLLFLLARNYSKYGKSFSKSGYHSTSAMYYQKSIDYYKQLLEIDPNNVSANYNLAVLYYNRGVQEYKKGEKADLEAFSNYFTKAKELLLKAKSLKDNPNIDKMLSKITETLGE